MRWEILLSFVPSLVVYRKVIFHEAFEILSAVIFHGASEIPWAATDGDYGCSHVDEMFGDTTQPYRALDWVTDRVSPLRLILDGALPFLPIVYLMVAVVVIVFWVGVVILAVFCVPAVKMPPTLPPHASDCAMFLVSISYGDFVMGKDCESCGACSMKEESEMGSGCVLASQSLVYPVTRFLYCAREPALSNLVLAIVNVSACVRGCAVVLALEVGRRVAR